MPQKGKPVEQTVSDIINFLRASRITGMVGGRIQETPNGTIIHVIPGKSKGGTSTASSPGAFYRLITIASGDVTNGDIYLQGGTASGGTGNQSVADFLLYDASATTWAGTAGQHLQLAITGSGQVTSGILDPIFNVTAATSSVVASLTANTLPSAASTSGKICYVSLGTFAAAGFYPSALGNVQVSFCWGGYNVSRQV